MQLYYDLFTFKGRGETIDQKKAFDQGNYSRGETIQGRLLGKEIPYYDFT